MKIKDIINEQGFASGFVKGFLGGLKPKAFQNIEQPKVGSDLTSAQAAMQAQKEFGDNPESRLPGFLGWVSDQERDELERQAKNNKKKKQRELDKEKVAKGKEKLKKDILSKFDQFGTTSKPNTATTAQAAAPAIAPVQAPPPQVKLPSGEYITKRGGSWYDEQGQKIVIPSDIERLERMAQGPSGQASMASTKNIPVQLPGYRGKRR